MWDRAASCNRLAIPGTACSRSVPGAIPIRKWLAEDLEPTPRHGGGGRRRAGSPPSERMTAAVVDSWQLALWMGLDLCGWPRQCDACLALLAKGLTSTEPSWEHCTSTTSGGREGIAEMPVHDRWRGQAADTAEAVAATTQLLERIRQWALAGTAR